MTPIAFNPVNGQLLSPPLTMTIEDAHRWWPAKPGNFWFFCPWTGKPRDSRDVYSDPWGHAVVHSTDPLKAATITPNEASGEDWPADGAARAATPFFQVAGYETLADVLQRAYEQAACGKGRDRHAGGLPFHEQPMQRIEALVGGGFCAGQAIKKIQESGRMDRDAAVRELLGAINYIAGNIIALERAGVSKPGV